MKRKKNLQNSRKIKGKDKVMENSVRRSQMSFKIGAEKFCKFDRKTPVLESLFNKVAGLESSYALLVLFYPCNLF